MRNSPQKITFPSADGLPVTAELYEAERPEGFILLCHRSHCNRAEYRETAPRLNDLGFSCLAIDQRSGMRVFGETNETKERARAAGLPTGYLDAKPDIEAAIEQAYALNGERPIIVFGSSYSASLALLRGAKGERARAMVAYSPGEYLTGIDLADELRKIDRPIYVTSSRAEVEQLEQLVRNVDPTLVTRFVPTAAGFHGSKALWSDVDGHEAYWTSLKEFLRHTVAEPGRGTRRSS
ncbi:MAG: alpha/beta hydrolase [Actinobacteria bacterium]|nr:alpha/beta hydrolase [Actinomycetota bacterium]